MKSVKTVAKVIKVLSLEKKYATYENSIDKCNYYMQDMFYDACLKDESYRYCVEHSWYEHVLKISYKSKNKTYENLVTLVSDIDSVQEKQTINIEYEKGNPYNVISATLKSRYTIWWALFALLSLFVLIFYIIHLTL